MVSKRVGIFKNPPVKSKGLVKAKTKTKRLTNLEYVHQGIELAPPKKIKITKEMLDAYIKIESKKKIPNRFDK